MEILRYLLPQLPKATHFDKIFGRPHASLVSGGITLLLRWFILNWMYKKKLFIQI